MMLCKADFDELFPNMFDPGQRPLAALSSAAPDIACITRWEDDGGRTLAIQPRPMAVAAKARHYGYNPRDPGQTGLILAMMPVTAAVGAAYAMIAAWDRQTQS